MKRIKHLGINLPKGTEYLHKENYKTIIEEIKDDRNRQKYAIYVDQKNEYSENEFTTQNNLQIHCNPYQATKTLEQTLSQFVWKHKKTLNSQSNLEQEE